jgi:hypothetical protein
MKSGYFAKENGQVSASFLVNKTPSVSLGREGEIPSGSNILTVRIVGPTEEAALLKNWLLENLPESSIDTGGKVDHNNPGQSRLYVKVLPNSVFVAKTSNGSGQVGRGRRQRER